MTRSWAGAAASRDEARRLRLAARLGSGKGPHSRRPSPSGWDPAAVTQRMGPGGLDPAVGTASAKLSD